MRALPRALSIDKRIWDSSLVVVLDRPLARGEQRKLTFVYELVVANYAAGRSWYPGLPDNFTDLHTAALTFHHTKKQEVRSSGALERTDAAGDVVTSAWAVTRPAKMVSFAFGGQVLLEMVFSWPGMGRLMVAAVTQRDYPVAQAAFLLMAVIVVLVNVAVDLLYLRLSTGAMTNRLDRMEAAGLIRRLPDPNDRRGTLVEPTEAGHAAWNEATGTQARREAMISNVLSERDREELHRLLRRLMRAFPDSAHSHGHGHKTRPANASEG